MSREYNYGGTSLIVDSIEELFENGAVQTKTVSNIKQVIGLQRQSKDINKLKEQIKSATDDGVITVSEKPGLKREWASLESSYATISDKFTQDDTLKDNSLFYVLKARFNDLSPIMDEIFADMNSSYQNAEKISKLTALFVDCWEYITLCSQLWESRLSISDRFTLQISPNREIVGSLDIRVTLLYLTDGAYSDVTNLSTYLDSDFVWKKTSDENFERTGKVLSLTLDDMKSNEEQFSLTFKHTYKYQDANETEVVIAKSISFAVSTGTLSQWTWSDAATKEELLLDPLAIWLDYRREFNEKRYLWRRDTDDVLKADSEKEWIYFRESGLDGIDGYSRAQLTLYKRSASGEPSKSDLGTITYTFATNAYSGTLGGWSTSIPSGDGELYAIYASAFFNGATDTVEQNEWTTPAKLSTDGAKGEDGMSIYTVLLFKRSASTPSKPSGTVTYNFHTNTLTGADGWYREPPASDGNPIYSITATAASNTGTDVISPSEWSTPMIFVKDGKNGEDGKNGANGTDAKLIRLSADKTIFSLDSNGKPYSGQVATVTVDKQGIADTHRITGTVSAPDNATEFKVTPQMMGYEPITLTNLFDFRQVVTNNSTSINLPTRIDLTQFNNLTQGMTTLEKIDYLCNLVWVVRASTITVTNIRVLYFYIKIDLQNSDGTSLAVEVNTRNSNNMLGPTDPVILANKTYSISLYWKKNELLQKYNEGYTTIKSVSMSVYYIKTDTSATSSYSMTINDSGLYNIKELLAQPKLQAMTDSDRLNWMATYLGFTAEAGSSWTIGGKAKNLELLRWCYETTPVEGQPGVYQSTSTPTAGNSPYAIFALSSSDKEGHVLCARVSTKRIDGDASYIVSLPDGSGWNYREWGRIYKSFSTEWESYTGGGAIYSDGESRGYINVYPFYTSSSFPTVNTTFHNRIDNVFNLTASGWLAQLSLMGIETNEAIKNWIDTYIPFFDGELDFPRFPSIEIKATAGSYTDYLTIGTQIQPRTLRLSSSPISIELDAEGHSDEEVTVTAHTQNIYGDIAWSNNRGLPVVQGNVQRFRASQLGLKPITLKQMLSDTFENSGNWSNSSGSITVSNGVFTQTTSAGGSDFVASKGMFPVSKDRTYYACVNIDSISSYNGNMRLYMRYNGAITDQNYTGVTASIAGKRFGRILKPTVSTDSATIAFGVCDTSTSTTVAFSKPALYDVTELLAHPKFSSMTDSQKLEWLNTYIPTIKAGESWTIGGKAKNYVQPYATEWTDSEAGAYPMPAGTVSESKKEIKQNDVLYSYAEARYTTTNTTPSQIGFYADDGYIAYRSFDNPVENSIYIASGIVTLTRYVRANVLTVFCLPRGAIGQGKTSVRNNARQFNLTASGWLAQLSLMGIEGNANVKAWIDANVPFFVGEFDFPAYRDVTWTAEYEEVSDSVTVGAKKNDFKIESSHESYALSPRGVCKNRQTMTFHVDALGLTEQPSWRIYYDGEVVEQDIKGNTISWTLEINETPRTITAEVTSGNYYDILTLNAMVNGNPMPERVTGGYSSRMIPQDEIRSIKALDDGVSPLIEGDYALVAIINDEGKTEPTPYRYSGVQWTPLGGNESNASEIFFALQNDAWATDDTMATAQIIIAWIKNLISQNAFIENLKIANAFSSTNYEEDANGMPVSGWKGDTDSGTLKSHKMVTHGMTAYDATVQGNIEHDSLKTIEAKSGDLSGTWADSTKTHWSFKSLMEGVPRYTGAAGTYHNAFRSGSITYNGVTYDQYYSKMWESTPESQHTYTYTKHLGKASGGHILGGGESGESVSSIASHMGITLQSNEAVRLNFHCSGATTRFDFYINGQLSYSEKVDGVGVFNGWLRPSDIVRIYCYNSNIFNERDLTCDVTLYQVGYPMQPLTTAPANLGPGVPADIGEDGEATTSYAEKSWTVPTGKLINQAWVSFNADVFYVFETSAELYVNGNVVASFNKNTDWYKINWKATVKGGDTITLRVYSIRPSADPTTYYYCRAYGVVCAFGYINNAKGLYLQQSSGSATLVLPFYAESEPAGWTDKSISTSLTTVTKQYLIGDKFISTLVTAWGSANMNREIICTSSKIIVDGVETAIDRVRLTDEGLSYRTTAGVWKSIVKLSQMGLYKSLSLTVATLAQILSIETASVVPKVDYAYQIGTPEKRFNSSYIKEHHINGWRMSASNSELTFIYEG